MYLVSLWIYSHGGIEVEKKRKSRMFLEKNKSERQLGDRFTFPSVKALRTTIDFQMSV